MPLIRCVIVGDSLVGKTCMLLNFTNGEFPEEGVPRVFENDGVIEIELEDKTVRRTTFLDTPGDEVFKKQRPLSYPRADLVIMCYSVVSPKTLESIKTKWYTEVRHYCPTAPVVLVGTKTDLREDEFVLDELKMDNSGPVTQEQVNEVAKEIGAATCVECSAKTGENVKLVFQQAFKTVPTK